MLNKLSFFFSFKLVILYKLFHLTFIKTNIHNLREKLIFFLKILLLKHIISKIIKKY